MNQVLLDTHAWAWSLTADRRLSYNAIEAIEQADAVCISAISLYEIGQKVRLGKWPEMAPFLHQLTELANLQGARILAVSPDVCLQAATQAWSHRDPFDRIIGTTAMAMKCPLISADRAFDELAAEPGWPGRVW